MKVVFMASYYAISMLFVVAAIALTFFGAIEMWEGIDPSTSAASHARFARVLEGMGLLTVAVAALELAQTILEEEIRREAVMSSPTRVRRFLSRFLVVIVVALSIEFLVAVFGLVHENPAGLPAASSVGLAVAAILVGWGVFTKFNRSVEELEPEAMQRVKDEDDKVG